MHFFSPLAEVLPKRVYIQKTMPTMYKLSFMIGFGSQQKLQWETLSWVFMILLMLILLSILSWSKFYMGFCLYSLFSFLIFWFYFSMVGLVFCSSPLVWLLCWDMLGVSSFGLVLWYLSWSSVSGAMLTVMTNRLGDFLLLSAFLTMGNWVGEHPLFVAIPLLELASMTKSAQWPFSGWLTKAMSAPTPVSALVHSSTLVTAGIFLLSFFQPLVSNWSFLMPLSLCNLILATTGAILEKDMKKQVALSTLSQISLCFYFMSVGYYMVAFTHMLSHSLFKSLLFLQVGSLIHKGWGEQENRNHNSQNLGNRQVKLGICVLSLGGLLLSGGLLSKEILMECYLSSPLSVSMTLLFISIPLTMFYSAELMTSGLMQLYGVSPKRCLLTWKELLSGLTLAVSTQALMFLLNMNFLSGVSESPYETHASFWLLMSFLVVGWQKYKFVNGIHKSGALSELFLKGTPVIFPNTYMENSFNKGLFHTLTRILGIRVLMARYTTFYYLVMVVLLTLIMFM